MTHIYIIVALPFFYFIFLHGIQQENKNCTFLVQTTFYLKSTGLQSHCQTHSNPLTEAG